MKSTKNQAFHVRLGFALAGIRQGLKTERSMRVHVAIAALVLVALIVMRPAPLWWALMILATVAVIAAELINTALEHLIDHLHPGIHAEIRIVKDCAAAAVLVTACGAVGVAIAFAASLWHR